MAEPVTLRPGCYTTLEQREAIEQAVGEYLEATPSPTIRGAAQAAGISHVTLYRMMDQHKAMGERIYRGLKYSERAAVDEVVEAQFERACDVRNSSGAIAAMFLLKSHRRALYGDRFTGMGPAGITVNIDKAQINLEREASREMRELEGE